MYIRTQLALAVGVSAYSIIEEPNKERNLLDYLSIDIKDIRLVEYTEIEYKKYLGI